MAASGPTRRGWVLTAGSAAILHIVALGVAVAIAPTVDESSGAVLVEFFERRSASLRLVGTFFALTQLLVLLYFASLVHIVPDAQDRGLATLTVALAATSAAVGLVGIALQLAPLDIEGPIGGDVARLLFASDKVFGTVSLMVGGAALATSGIWMLRARALPVAIGWGSIVVGASTPLLGAALLIAGSLLAHSPLILILPLWVLVTAVALLGSLRRPVEATA